MGFATTSDRSRRECRTLRSRCERTHHGEVWAGRVSMTSAAVLAYTPAQQWGGLEQAVLNLAQKPSSYDSWLENARARGLTLGASGDKPGN